MPSVSANTDTDTDWLAEISKAGGQGDAALDPIVRSVALGHRRCVSAPNCEK
jgi:hypothetical protein